MTAALLLTAGTHGAVSLLIGILILLLVMAVVYWIASLVLPHPFPILLAAVVFLIWLLTWVA